MTGAELIAVAEKALPLTKYAASGAGKVVSAVRNWSLRRRIRRIESTLDYVHANASRFPLPDGFEQQEEFEDFAAAVFETGLHTSGRKKQKILAQFLLNEAVHGGTVAVNAKTKILELLSHVQPHHLELLVKFQRASAATGTACPRIQDWENELTSLTGTPDDRLDLFYSTVSDLLRWFLIRSSATPTGVNVAKVAHFIPGTSNASHLRITQLGEHMLGYVRDPQGQFDDFDAIIAEATS